MPIKAKKHVINVAGSDPFMKNPIVHTTVNVNTVERTMITAAFIKSPGSLFFRFFFLKSTIRITSYRRKSCVAKRFS